MGQFLATGIITQCAAEKKNMLKYNITKEELLEQMQKQLHFAPEIYDLTESEKYYIFDLQPDVFQIQLIPFLEKYYLNLHLKNTEYQDVIEMLSKTPANEWIEKAKRKSFEAFQFDEYGTEDFLDFKKDFLPSVRIGYDSILLSLEGKIMMECYGQHFNFFRYCIQQAFSEFLISKAIRVYITG